MNYIKNHATHHTPNRTNHTNNREGTSKHSPSPFPFPSPFRERLQGERLQEGMTLLEIIMVIALLGSLMVYLVSNLTGAADSAKEDQTRLAMGQIGQALQMYRIHNNQYPTNEQGLSALVNNPGINTWRRPYIEAEKLVDPWGNPFAYQSSGSEYQIISNGLDGVPGNADDISYPDSSQAGGDEQMPSEP